MSKHTDIIKYIETLKIGSKVSVRSIAGALSVSEGTAYRAIKDAENYGFVNTIPRVGTVRVERLEKKNIERLTFLEVVNILDGTILGGIEGLSMTLNNFVIGAMTMESMKKYIVPGSLLIVGDREEAQVNALENGCSVLITGGLKCSDYVRSLADSKKLPLLSCSYDTFTTATMLNKAISENLIKKDILLIEDIMIVEVSSVQSGDTIKMVRETFRRSKHSKFPVLDDNGRLVGMLDFKDVGMDISEDETVVNLMNKRLITLGPKTSVAYAAHVMTWEGPELIPILDGKLLVGVVGRNDVIKALQHVNKQPHMVETIDDIVMSNFVCSDIENGICLKGTVNTQMLNNTGTGSWSTLSLIMSSAGINALRRKNHLNVEVDSFTVFYVKPVQLDMGITIEAKIIDTGRNISKVEIEMAQGQEKSGQTIGKALLSARVIRK